MLTEWSWISKQTPNQNDALNFDAVSKRFYMYKILKRALTVASKLVLSAFVIDLKLQGEAGGQTPQPGGTGAITAHRGVGRWPGLLQDGQSKL